MLTTYTQKVPYLTVLLKGSNPGPHVIKAANIEDEGKTITLKDQGGKLIGSFDKAELAGWWISEDSALEL